jgi:hypothetical protein
MCNAPTIRCPVFTGTLLCCCCCCCCCCFLYCTRLVTHTRPSAGQMVQLAQKQATICCSAPSGATPCSHYCQVHAPTTTIVKLQHQQVYCPAAAAAACVMLHPQTIRRADGAAGEEAGHDLLQCSCRRCCSLLITLSCACTHVDQLPGINV